ncbi:hypothetical protein CBL_13680 [Carabus blaptoides fortunei]
MNVDDSQVEYRRNGKNCIHGLQLRNSTKPMVLLLHGIGSSADVWWDVLHCLVSAGYEVLAPDMLGHGYSSVPDCTKAYTFPSLLKDTIAIFDKYVPCTELGQCIIIGHSFGCSLAGALARYREQQVVQLVLISGGGPTPLAPPVSSTELSVFGCMQILMKPLLFCGMKRTMFYSSRGKHFNVCEPETAVPAYVLRYISEGQDWPEGDAAFHRRIFIPTLLVHGMQDTSVTLVQECEMERTIPRSFLEVIPAAGHMAMIETPEQLCHMLLCFFQWWTK